MSVRMHWIRQQIWEIFRGCTFNMFQTPKMYGVHGTQIEHCSISKTVKNLVRFGCPSWFFLEGPFHWKFVTNSSQEPGSMKQVSMFVSDFDEAMWTRKQQSSTEASPMKLKIARLFPKFLRACKIWKWSDALMHWHLLVINGSNMPGWNWNNILVYIGNIGNFHCRSQIETNQ